MASASRDDVALSKAVSHALRHDPSSYGLELDPSGWVGVEAFVAGLRGTASFREASIADVERVVAASPKQRFELSASRNRARYGHSIQTTMTHRVVKPPARLFHGTSADATICILKEGLLPMSRTKVHLTEDVASAETIRRRKSPQPVVLEADAIGAHCAGITFQAAGHGLWLSDPIDPLWLSQHGALGPGRSGSQDSMPPIERQDGPGHPDQGDIMDATVDELRIPKP